MASGNVKIIEQTVKNLGKAKELHELQSKHRNLWSNEETGKKDPKGYPGYPQLLQLFEQGVPPDTAATTALAINEVVDAVTTGVIERVRDRRVIFVVGQTGAGKSSFCNWVSGKTLQVDENEDGEPILQIEGGEEFPTGSGKESVTFAPQVRELPFTVPETIEEDQCIPDGDGSVTHEMVSRIEEQAPLLCDFAGFFDTNGIVVRVGMDLAFRKILRSVRVAHVVALIPVDVMKVERGGGLKHDLNKLKRLMPTLSCNLGLGEIANASTCCHWTVGITKCSKEFVRGNPRKQFEEIKGKVFSIVGVEDTRVVNVNDILLSGDADGATKFMRQVIATSSVSTDLRSDCLDVKDTATLQGIFQCQLFIKGLVETRLTPILGPVTCTPPRDCSVGEAERAVTRLSHTVDGLCTMCSILKKDMQETKRLGVEKEFDQFAKLAKHEQPRLRLLFIDGEKQVAKTVGHTITELRKTLVDIKNSLAEGKLINREQSELLDHDAEKLQSFLDEKAKARGFASNAEESQKWWGSTAVATGKNAGKGAVGVVAVAEGGSLLVGGSYVATYTAMGSLGYGATVASIAVGGGAVLIAAACVFMWIAQNNEMEAKKQNKRAAALEEQRNSEIVNKIVASGEKITKEIQNAMISLQKAEQARLDYDAGFEQLQEEMKLAQVWDM